METTTDAILVYALLTVLLSLSIRISSKWKAPNYATRPDCKPKPYRQSVPWIGHALSMMWNSDDFLNKVTSAFSDVPVRLNVLIAEFYVMSGPKAIAAVWKDRNLHARAYKKLSVINMMATPKDAFNLWMSEDSGVYPAPHPESRIPAHLRIDFFIYNFSHRFLSGPSLKKFTYRFVENMLRQLDGSSFTDTDRWTEVEDLWVIFREHCFQAAVTAMCGDYFFKLNPSFIKDYWDFNSGIHLLAKGIPRWIYPKPYRVRDKCLESVKKWHKFIKPYIGDGKYAKLDWNPYYGASIMRYRNLSWANVGAFDADAAATEDLGLIWAANANSVTASFWMVAEVIQQPSLYKLVKQRIEPNVCLTKDQPIDLDKLCNDPLMQATYAEALRIYVSAFLMRSPERKDFHYDGWTMPPDSIMLISGRHAQMNQSTWDPLNNMPVAEFHPERFLFHPNGEPVAKIEDLNRSELEAMTYSMEGRAAWWLPYGGGNHMCPGRHFAKQEMIGSTAIMLTLFDIESLQPQVPKYDIKCIGFGALQPSTKLRVRLRRKMNLGES